MRDLLSRPGYVLRRLRYRILNRTGFALKGITGYRSFFPGGVDLNLTELCNLRCAMCDLWNPGIAGERDVRAMRKSELTPDEWRGVIRDLAPYSPSLNLIGGEVLLYPGLEAVLAEARAHDLFTTLFTNGTLLDRHLESLARHPVGSLVTSIDGLHGTHDAIRAVPGAFDQITANLREFHRRVPSTPIHIHTVITRYNIGEIEALADYFEAEGYAASLKFIHLLSIAPAAYSAHREFLAREFDIHVDYWKGAQVDHLHPDPAEVVRRLEAVARRPRKIFIRCFPEISLPNVPRYYLDKQALYAERFSGRCRFLYSGLVIKSSGDAVLCPDQVIGSVRTSSIRQIINSPMARRLRLMYDRKGSFPACPACCFGYIGSDA